MIGLKKMLLEEQRRLEEILKNATEQLLNAPEGTVHISNSKGYTQFYLCNEQSGKQDKYIKKADSELIRQLVQKSYVQKIQKITEKRLSQIKRITKDYDDDEIEKIFSDMHAERKKIVEPIVATWEQELERWMKKEYQGKQFREGSPAIYSDQGERVRSKSEKIMADYFYRHSIPYKYECPLVLRGIGTVYPDFTFLSPRTKEEIYWEHDGMMDDPNYARSAIKKLEAYEKNGIYMGERLIVTFETTESVLNTSMIENNVKRFLI